MIEKLTIKSQEALNAAREIARKHENQNIEPEHVLTAFIQNPDSIVSSIVKKIGIQPEIIINQLEKIIRSFPKVYGGTQGKIFLSRDTEDLLDSAWKAAKGMKDEYISSEHILIAITRMQGKTGLLLTGLGITEEAILTILAGIRGTQRVSSQDAEDRYNALKKFTRDLNELARFGKLDPVIGRDEEIRRVLQVLSRRTKNNPVLIGEPGVGKTAVAEGIAQRIVNGDVPENLKDKRIAALDMGLLIAGAKFRGEFEERLKSVLKEIEQQDGKIVVFIDEIHTMVGAGAAEGAVDASNMLKPALARGELRCVGATTLDEYRKHIEKDAALERRFQPVLIGEPSVSDTISILRGLKERYEVHHGVRIQDGALIAAAALSDRYISDRFLPDKAIDLIDEAASKLRIEIDSMPEELDEVERRIKQLQIEQVALKMEKDKKSRERLSAVKEELSNLQEKSDQLKIQWQAEKEIIQKIRNTKEDLEKNKTAIEQAERDGDLTKAAELKYGKLNELNSLLEQENKRLQEVQKDRKMLKEEVDEEDVADIVSKWTGIPVSKMIESEKSKILQMPERLHRRVVGQDEAVEAVTYAIKRSRTGLQDEKRPIGSFIFLGSTGVGKTELARSLAEFLFDDENALVRIDMSEYMERHSVSRLIGAPPGYVGYDEGGQLTEAVRRHPYSVILLDEIEKAHPEVFNILLQILDEGHLTDNKGKTVNFKNTVIIMTSNLGSDLIKQKSELIREDNREEMYEKIRDEVVTLLRNTLRPEFVNRIDDIIVFHPLSKDDLLQIVDIQFARLAKMLRSQNLTIELDDSAKKYLTDKGYDPVYGARPLKRLIQKELVNSISDALLEERFNGNRHLRVADKDNNLVLLSK